jgi:hypothetical protein
MPGLAIPIARIFANVPEPQKRPAGKKNKRNKQ